MPLPPPMMDPNLTWIVIYQMLLMLLPSSITPLSETGPITSETSILHSRVAMTERARHASRAAMPAPKIRRLQFNFPSLSLSLSLHISLPPALSHTFLACHWRYVSLHLLPFSPKPACWNSNFAAPHLFPSAAVALTHSGSDCYLTRFLSLHLKADPSLLSVNVMNNGALRTAPVLPAARVPSKLNVSLFCPPSWVD